MPLRDRFFLAKKHTQAGTFASGRANVQLLSDFRVRISGTIRPTAGWLFRTQGKSIMTGPIDVDDVILNFDPARVQSRFRMAGAGLELVSAEAALPGAV